MAKRKGGKGGGFKMGELAQQAGLSAPGGMKGGLAGQLQDLQNQMMETQEALGDKEVEVTTGGGMVKVVMTGHQKLKSISINPEVVDSDDVEMLEDLILAAFNEAVDKSQNLAAGEMQGLTGGLNIPGLSNLF